MSDKYCPYCTLDTGGNHEHGCPSHTALYPVSSIKIERMGDLDGYEVLKEHHKDHHEIENEEVARYREALEWYAGLRLEMQWKSPSTGGLHGGFGTYDLGQRARDALAGIDVSPVEKPKSTDARDAFSFWDNPEDAKYDKDTP